MTASFVTRMTNSKLLLVSSIDIKAHHQSTQDPVPQAAAGSKEGTSSVR